MARRARAVSSVILRFSRRALWGERRVGAGVRGGMHVGEVGGGEARRAERQRDAFQSDAAARAEEVTTIREEIRTRAEEAKRAAKEMKRVKRRCRRRVGALGGGGGREGNRDAASGGDASAGGQD